MTGHTYNGYTYSIDQTRLGRYRVQISNNINTWVYELPLTQAINYTEALAFTYAQIDEVCA